MAKIVAVLRDRVNGDPVAGETVTFRAPGGGSIGTDDTGADGSAMYSANANPAGLITWDATVSGEVRQAGARAQRQIGPIFEAELAKTLKTIMSDGYADGDGDEAQVVPGSGRQVIVGTGCVWVQGIPFHFYDDTPLASTANATLATRLDRVILRVELDDSSTDYGKGTLVYLEGTVNNTLPTITQDTEDTYEYVLANVTSALGFSSYTSGNISDQRAQAGPTAVGAAITAALALKADAANPVFTGTPTFTDGSIAQVDVSGLVSALALLAPKADPVFTGTVGIPDGALAIADTNGLQAALDAKASTSAVAGKVDDTGDTMTGLLRITENADPSFVVERETGNDVLRVMSGSAPGALFLANGAVFGMLSDHDTTFKFYVDGANGNLTSSGAATFNGAVRITANGDPDFIVEGASGGDLLYVSQTYNAVHVANGGEFSTVDGTPGSSTKTFIVDGLTGRVTMGGRLYSAGTSPSLTLDSNAGTGRSASISGTDMAGTITLNTGTGTAAGVQMTVTFATAKSSADYTVILSPGNANASGAWGRIYAATKVAASFQLIVNTTALTASSTYIFEYAVIEREA